MQDDELQQDGTIKQHEAMPERVDPCVWREVTIEATPEEVWELLGSEAGRRQWLEPDPGRTIEVIESEPPRRLVWRWRAPDISEHRVEIIAVPEDERVRVIVIESGPSVPLAMLAAAAADLHSAGASHRWTLALA